MTPLGSLGSPQEGVGPAGNDRGWVLVLPPSLFSKRALSPWDTSLLPRFQEPALSHLDIASRIFRT